MKSTFQISLTASLLALSALTFAQRPYYQPAVGDVMQVWKSTFTKANFYSGHQTLLRELLPFMERDNRTRMTVVAENAATHVIVTVQFSSPYDVGGKGHADKFPGSRRVDQGNRTLTTANITSANIEGYKPRIGDDLVLWFAAYRPGSEANVDRIYNTRMWPVLRKDKYTRNSYFGETEVAGKYLGVNLQKAGEPTRPRVLNTLNPLKPFQVGQTRNEVYRIIAVHNERQPAR